MQDLNLKEEVENKIPLSVSILRYERHSSHNRGSILQIPLSLFYKKDTFSFSI